LTRKLSQQSETNVSRTESSAIPCFSTMRSIVARALTHLDSEIAQEHGRRLRPFLMKSEFTIAVKVQPQRRQILLKVAHFLSPKCLVHSHHQGTISTGSRENLLVTEPVREPGCLLCARHRRNADVPMLAKSRLQSSGSRPSISNSEIAPCLGSVERILAFAV